MTFRIWEMRRPTWACAIVFWCVLSVIPLRPTPSNAGTVVKDSQRWPNAVVPFRFSAGINTTLRTRIQNAVQHWNSKTNITLRPRRPADRNFVTFRIGGNCSSDVGCRGGEQMITLTAGCSTAAAIHEIGHAVGLYHEQQREDRDRFVKTYWDNIIERNRHNFRMKSKHGDPSGPYDYRSIMHYSSNAFAINNAMPTIRVRNSSRLTSIIGSGAGLSTGDIVAVNALYPRDRWDRPRGIARQLTKRGPALAVYGGRLHMVRLARHRNDIWHSSYDGRRWSRDVKIPGCKSQVTPALAVFRGKLHMIHRSERASDLWHTTYDGRRWSKYKKIRGLSSRVTPALVVFENRLHVFQLRGFSTTIWQSTFDGRRWSTSRKIAGKSTKTTPSLVVHGRRLHMVHLGRRSNNIWYSSYYGGRWTRDKQIPSQTSKAAPSLVSSGGKLHLFHLGNKSNDIWHSRLVRGWWRPNLRVRQQSTAPVAVVHFKGRVHLVYRSTNSLLVHSIGSLAL